MQEDTGRLLRKLTSEERKNLCSTHNRLVAVKRKLIALKIPTKKIADILALAVEMNTPSSANQRG